MYCFQIFASKYKFRYSDGPRYLSRYNDPLRTGRFGDRIPVWGATFFEHVQPAPRAHPASYTKGTGSFPRGKATGSWPLPPATSSTEVKEEVELYLYPPLCLHDWL